MERDPLSPSPPTFLWVSRNCKWHCPRLGYVSVRGSSWYHRSSQQCRSCRHRDKGEALSSLPGNKIPLRDQVPLH